MSETTVATRVIAIEGLGRIVVEVVDDAVWSVSFTEAAASDAGRSSTADAVADWLARYVQAPCAPPDVPLASRGTSFQREVWAALRDIPAGTTWTYAQLAGAVGRPRGAQAVGAANGANPWAILVPCHRVIGRDGGLVGYAGGLDRKRWLLAHEGAISGMLF